MTDAPATDPAPSSAAPAAASRNPGPRPALGRRAEDDAVVSARPRTETAAAAALATPARPTTPPEGKRKDKHKGLAKPKDQDAKKPKDARKHKDKAKDKTKDDGPKPTRDTEEGRDDKALVVSLPKPVRKALSHAASEHGTTPERLVALVISEWLDH